MNAEKLLDNTLDAVVSPGVWIFKHVKNPFLRLLLLPICFVCMGVLIVFATPVMFMGMIILLVNEQ